MLNAAEAVGQSHMKPVETIWGRIYNAGYEPPVASGDKYWALNTSSGNQYRLNDVSYFILNLLRIQMSTAQVVDEVLREYAVAREQAVIDCGKLLQFAIENAIVKEVDNT